MDWWNLRLTRLPRQEWYEKVFGAAANSIPGTWWVFHQGPSKVRSFGSWLHKKQSTWDDLNVFLKEG
jgi:hypothetical protein